MMWLFMVSSIEDLLSASRTSSYHWIAQTFQQLKVDALRCDTRYWECQGEKIAPSGRNRQSASSSAPEKLGSNPTTSSDAPMASRTNPGIGADGKLTQEELE